MILRDLGTQFTSLVFESITKSLGIKLSHCTPQRPECNAQSERVNTSIKTSLLTLHEKGVSFQNALLIHQNIYNGTIHPSTGYSPNILHFGRNLSLLFDTFHPDPRPAQLDKSHYLCDLLTQLKLTYEHAYETLERKQVEQNTRQLKNAKLRSFSIDDVVYLKSKDTFKPRFSGPFCIVSKSSDVNYTIRALDNEFAQPFKIHINRLRLAPKRFSHLVQNPPPAPQVTHQYNLRKRQHV
ncbi:uncharacterized protein LOC118181543 [Stegodyphus dumicola]|uniref:uncharacterized protein LOC118181543 n=1 Tax=Stegodyphus dumicola TaxID=202533 RepID=UPI0015A8E998|nr:uncharacterized protein LOC118181543 [Stegodyphus dumicola]